MKNRRAIFLLLLANSISGVAQGISMLAIPWYFTGVLHREELFGKAYFIVTALSLFWGLYAGTLVDRFDRKKIFLITNMVGFVILSAVSSYGFIHQQLPWLLVASIFATTVFVYSIHFPNLYAFAQEITPKEQYSRITSLIEIQGQLTFTIAGGLAAVLLTGTSHEINLLGFNLVLPFSINAWKIHEVFAVDAATYLISFLIIYQIRTLYTERKTVDKANLFTRIKTGFAFLKAHPALFHFGNASLLLFLTILVFGTYIQPIYVVEFLKKGGDVYAFGDMAFSAGALLAGFITTKLFQEKNAVRGVIALSIVAGTMYCFMAVNTILLLFFAADFLIGSCNAAVRIQRITFLFHHTPNHIIGRTGSVFFVINVILRLCLIGILALPFFHAGANIVYAVAILSAICFAGAAILIYYYSRLVEERVKL